VQEGTLRRGDVLLAGSAHGKVRAMLDDRGRQVDEAGPSMPVEVIGLNDVPSAGDPVHSVKNLKQAQEIASSRKTRDRRTLPSHTKISLEDLQARLREASQLDLKLVVKADVQGSLEAIHHALGELSGEKVRVTFVHTGVGAITEGDINLAVAAGALVIGFNVRPAGKAGLLAQKEGIEIRQYSVIYDVSDDVKKAMEGLLEPIYEEKPLGQAEVRKVFKIPGQGAVGGCMVTSGVVRRNGHARVHRGDEMLFEGKVATLKRFKDDAKEVRDGLECGIGFSGFNDLAEGDRIEAYELESKPQSL
jgi:translation initiation factor IF-2